MKITIVKHILLCCLFFLFVTLYAQANEVNWLKANITLRNIPKSFGMLDSNKIKVWQSNGGANNMDSAFERIILNEGLIIYDGAVWSIALTYNGEVERARNPFNIYWNGSLGSLQTIRGGYAAGSSSQPFIYDTIHPEAVSSIISDTGTRGYVFKLIDAAGNYSVIDPLTNTGSYWQDWKPISGENAWVVIAAAHYLRVKYKTSIPDTSSVLKLAKELARCAIMLQAGNGGIRMAPEGTYNPGGNNIMFNTISTENNASWYAAFNMLYTITGNIQYRTVRDSIASYLRWIFNPASFSFYQGATFRSGQWLKTTTLFAFDCQTWTILALTPDSLDKWFGIGTSYSILKNGIDSSGYSSQGVLCGVGFTSGHDQISPEWTAGAITAGRILSSYYKNSNPNYSLSCSTYAQQMLAGLDSPSLGLKTVTGDQTAYSYSLIRQYIPFGWWSQMKEVLSTAGTGWMALVADTINPLDLSHEDITSIMHSTQSKIMGTDFRIICNHAFLEYTGIRPTSGSIYSLSGRQIFAFKGISGFNKIKLPAYLTGPYLIKIQSGNILLKSTFIVIDQI